MMSRLRGWLAFVGIAVLMLAAPCARAQEEPFSLGAEASPVSSSMECSVQLRISSSLLGADSRMDLLPGSGSEWTVDGETVEQPWSFQVIESSLSFLLTDTGKGEFLFEADHSSGDESVIYQCRELPGKDIIAYRGENGAWRVEFPFDLSEFDSAGITLSLALDTDWEALAAGEAYRGIYPLDAASWNVGEENWQFPLTETGFVALPLPVEAAVRAEGTVLTDGDAAFVLKKGEKVLFETGCDENGRVDLSSFRLSPAAEDGTALTLSQLPETAGGLTADEAVYTLSVRTFPYEWNGSAWQTVRETRIRKDLSGTTEDLGTVREDLTVSFEDEALLRERTTQTQAMVCAFEDGYAAEGECVIRGAVRIPTRYSVAWENEFSLVLLSGGDEIGRTATKSGGGFAFPAIRYGIEDVGTHVYTVRQEEGKVGGIRYDLSGHEVRVEVRDLGHGVLEATALEEPEIINVYSAEGSLDLPVTTTLTGREIRDGEFVYGLFEGETLLGSAACDREGRAVIHLDYTIDDVREGMGTGHRSSQRAYTLRLINAESLTGGVVPDAGEIAIRVILTENGLGEVNASFVPDAASLVFNHVYDAVGKVFVTGQLSLTQGTLTDGQFGFVIEENGHTVASTSNNTEGELLFPAIVYHAEDVGEHTYKVSQVLSSSAGVFQDETVYTLTAEVADNGDGTLKADYVVLDSEDGRISFENGYQAHGSITLSFDIDLVGRAIGENEFSFRLFENGSILQEAWADTSGHVVFEPLTYRVQDVGTHIYVIRTGQIPQTSVESNLSAFNVVVDVKDGGYGKLLAVAREKPSTFAFVYTPYGVYELDAYISLKGRELKEGEMTFYIREGERVVSTGTNDIAGRIVFEPLEYSRKDIGTHVYTVAQSELVPGGVTRDTTNYSMTVYVNDDGNGTLVTECERLKNLSFACTYDAAGSYSPDVRVALTDASMRDGQFTFEIVEYGRIVKTQSNSPDGSVEFRPFAYTLADAGQHEYTVRQVGTGAGGIELDKNMYHLTVQVTDNGDGTLRAEAEPGSIVFTNKYVTRGTLLLQAGVELTGRSLEENEFEARILNGETVLATGYNGADGKILFPPIVLSNEDLRAADGTMQEKKTLNLKARIAPTGAGGGIALEQDVIPFKVHLADLGNGTIDASASLAPSEMVFRASYSSLGSLKLTARVLLDGSVPAQGSCKAGLYENGVLLAEAENGPDGVFDFPAMVYGLQDVGTHTYVISQTGRTEGIIRDDSSFTAECGIADHGNGSLEVTCEWKEPVFSNRTGNIGSMEAAARITLEGRPLRAQDFELVLTEDGKTISTGTNDAEGYVRFAPVSYTEKDLGEHRYLVGFGTLPAGVEAEEEKSGITVYVSRDGGGNVCWYTDDQVIPEFSAAYCAYASLAVEARVQVQGRVPEEGQFALALYRDGTLVQEKAMDADGWVRFDGIGFSSPEAGAYLYSLVQTTPDCPGYTLDRETKEIRVLVTDDLNGTLSARQDTVPVFSNVYRSAGSFVPAVTVRLEGRALQDGEFRFALEENGVQLGEAANDPDGTVRFEPIEFATGEDGRHQFAVRALTGDGNGLSLTGEGEAALSAEVRDLGDGTMEILPVDAPVFVYEYTASGSLQLGVRATLTGRDLKEGEFRYQLLDGGNVLSTASADRNGQAVFEPIPYGQGDAGEKTYTVRLTGTLPTGVSGPGEADVKVTAMDDGLGNMVFSAEPALPCAFGYVYAPTGSAAFAFRVVSAVPMEGGEYLISMTDEAGRTYTAVNDADGTVRFNPIQYTLADVGEHVYTIRQEKGSLGGVLYDETVYRINVKVTEEENGTLKCAYNAGNVEFVNGYSARGEWACRAHVTLKGLDANRGRITLSLTENGRVLSQADMDGEGNVTFAPLQFALDDAGVKEYRIYASSEAYSKLVCDEEGVKATVTVTDNGDGTLSCQSGPVPEILLSYESAGHATVEVKAVLEGRALKAEEFSFALYEGNELKDTARADETGRASFDVFFETDAAGTHVYTVRQLDPGEESVRWEDTVYQVTAEAVDLGNGEMEVRLTYPEGGVLYRNVYTASGKLQIRASVTLTGKALRAEQFSFALYRDGEQLAKAFNDQDGNVVFPAMELTGEDGVIIEYSVGQLPGSEQGITYDETVYPVLVRVTDDGEGTLTGDYAVPPAFRNSYGAAGEALLQAGIDLVGRKLSEGSFTLTLSEDGKVLQTRSNDAEGTVRFDPISYTLSDVGTHVYEIAESATAEAGVPLDPEVKTVRVEVSDRGDGTLRVAVTGNDPEFKNSFTAQTAFVIYARVSGNAPEEVLDAQLTLKDAEENLVEVIDARKGTNSFTPLVFTQADAGKQFVYTVSCSGNETVYTVRASVSDGLNGQMDVSSEITGPEGGVERIQFVVDYSVSLALEVRGAEEAVRFTVEFEQDGSRLLGEYPVEGAAESTIASGGVLTLERNGTAVIRDLPYGSSYRVVCGAVPRYEVTAENTEGVLVGQGTCSFALKLAQVSFNASGIWYGEDGTRKNEPLAPEIWTLYADGQKVDAEFKVSGTAVTVEGLPKGSSEGGELVYSATIDPPENTTVSYVNTGAHRDETEALYDGGTAVLQDGATFRIRVRFVEGTDENGETVYSYRSVTGTLYREDGETLSVTMNPDEDGWVVLKDIEKDMQYYVISSGVTGYTASYRNTREYGNVTSCAYDGGTITFKAGSAPMSRRQMLLYGGGAAAVLGLGAYGVAVLARKRRNRQDGPDETQNEEI